MKLFGTRSGPALLAAVMIGTLMSAQSFAADDRKSSGDEPSRAEMEQKLQDAQRRLNDAAREVADLSMSLSGDVMPHITRLQTLRPPRAVLGMVIGSAANSRRDDGVEVLSVSPGGGAAEAGLKAGDVLTEFNGKSLKASKEESPEKLFLDAMRALNPGDKVMLKYLRDGKSASATVEALPAPVRGFSMSTPPRPPVPPMGFPSFAFSRAEGVFGSAQLVSLTPKLGQYFGSDKGLLVVRAPSDARLKLEEGDVIVDIDGRVPSSPSHALQILGSYQGGEKLKLNVLRMKKRITFDVTIPKDSEWSRMEAPQPPDVLISTPPTSGVAPIVLDPTDLEPVTRTL